MTIVKYGYAFVYKRNSAANISAINKKFETRQFCSLQLRIPRKFSSIE